MQNKNSEFSFAKMENEKAMEEFNRSFFHENIARKEYREKAPGKKRLVKKRHWKKMSLKKVSGKKYDREKQA